MLGAPCLGTFFCCNPSISAIFDIEPAACGEGTAVTSMPILLTQERHKPSCSCTRDRFAQVTFIPPLANVSSKLTRAYSELSHHFAVNAREAHSPRNPWVFVAVRGLNLTIFAVCEFGRRNGSTSLCQDGAATSAEVAQCCTEREPSSRRQQDDDGHHPLCYLSLPRGPRQPKARQQQVHAQKANQPEPAEAASAECAPQRNTSPTASALWGISLTPSYLT